MSIPRIKNKRMELTLEGKSAIVTGGGSGIGAGIAEIFMEGGAKIVVADINVKAAEAFVNKADSSRRHLRPIQVDVRKQQDVNKMVQEAERMFGSVNILVNNAGIFPSNPILDMSEYQWDEVIETNLKGTFLCSQAVAKRMIQSNNGGKIINIVANGAFKPTGEGLAHYDASKAGCVALTRSLALELAPYKINVNAICPDAIETEGLTKVFKSQPQLKHTLLGKVPLERFGKPTEIGQLALFLASDASSFLTGSIVFADGGLILR